MAKIKKIRKNKKEIKIQNKAKYQKYNLKECVVKLDRIDYLLHRKETKKNYTKSVEIQIKKGQLKINNVPIEESDLGVFNIGIQIKSDKMSIQQLSNQNIAVENRIATKIVSQKVASKESIRIPTIYQLTNTAWRRCLAESKRKSSVLVVSQHVLAHMKSFVPWPAIIISFSSNQKRINVHFYGTNQKGTVHAKDVAAFQDASEVIRLLLLRKATLSGFEKAVREIEIINNIPIEESITVDLNSIQT